jgi:hypothetical protein
MAQQANWRFCQGCHAMFFAGYQRGRCPTGNPTSPKGSTSSCHTTYRAGRKLNRSPL